MIKKYLVSLFFLTLSPNALADEFCMDNSKHGYTQDGCDYKKYYYVRGCLCPCERYYHASKRNRCENCMHFNVRPPEAAIPYLDGSCE